MKKTFRGFTAIFAAVMSISALGGLSAFAAEPLEIPSAAVTELHEFEPLAGIPRGGKIQVRVKCSQDTDTKTLCFEDITPLKPTTFGIRV